MIRAFCGKAVWRWGVQQHISTATHSVPHSIRCASSVAAAGFDDLVPTIRASCGTDVLFGRRSLEKLNDVAAEFPTRVCVITSNKGEQRVPVLMYFLQKHGFRPLSFPVPSGPPTVKSLELAEQFARRTGCETVVAFGGGSVIDTARILAMKLGNSQASLNDYMKVVGGSIAESPSVPLLVVPTCPGSGTEVLKQSFLSFEEELMLPVNVQDESKQAVVLDPDLMDQLPQETAGMMYVATLMNLIETYVSPAASEESKAMSLAGLQICADNIRGTTKDAADKMMQASTLASAALTTAPAGVCQGLALGATAKYTLLYSHTAAAIASHALEATIETLEEQDDDAGDAALEEFKAVASVLSGGESTSPDFVIGYVADLVKDFNVESLDDHDLQDSDFVAIATAAEVLDSTQANAATLTRDQLVEILSES